jgi:hybrid cluster-associated redox disulfide protein
MDTTTNRFKADMTLGDALRTHERAREVFASFHLGGCAHCAMNESETIAQATAGYGIDSEKLLAALNELPVQ